MSLKFLVKTSVVNIVCLGIAGVTMLYIVAVKSNSGMHNKKQVATNSQSVKKIDESKIVSTTNIAPSKLEDKSDKLLSNKKLHSPKQPVKKIKAKKKIADTKKIPINKSPVSEEKSSSVDVAELQRKLLEAM